MDTNANSSPIATGSQLPPQGPEHTRIGPAAGIIIILVLVAAAGLYFWGSKLSQETSMEPPPYIPGDESASQPAATAAATQGLPAQSTSDDAASIEADFEQMNLNSVESQTSAEFNNL